jgi:predicted outer membrane repeat protein
MGTSIMGIRFAAIGVLLLGALAVQARAATVTVTNTNDSGPGSLRQALADANDADTIIFAVTGTITLTSGGLMIDKDVTISGPGADQLSIDGNQGDVVFGVDPEKTAAIAGLTIKNGQVGIGNAGALTVSNCAISGNSSGGLSNVATSPAFTNATLTIANSIVSDNSGPGIFNEAFMASATVTILTSTVTANGGGIYTRGFEGGTNITVTNCTISDNSADSGGGIYSYWSPVTIVNSTLSDNSAGTSGGGIYAEGPLVEISNSTVSGNSAGTSGGAIFNNTSGYVRIDNSTVSGNSAGSGGGIYTVSGVDVSDTILNAGVSGENIFNSGGMVTSYGYNLSSDDGGGYLAGAGDQIDTNPLLGPLQDNGGPTFTHALLPGSPAIDAGDPNFTPPPFYDQRGPNFVRAFNGRIDIGSFEAQPRPAPTPRPRSTPRPRPTPR